MTVRNSATGEKGTGLMERDHKHDSRTPIRTLDLGSVVGEVYQYADRTFVELTIRGAGRLTVFPHELKTIALISLLLERGEIGKRL